jgi:hypothetical protein
MTRRWFLGLLSCLPFVPKLAEAKPDVYSFRVEPVYARQLTLLDCEVGKHYIFEWATDAPGEILCQGRVVSMEIAPEGWHASGLGYMRYNNAPDIRVTVRNLVTEKLSHIYGTYDCCRVIEGGKYPMAKVDGEYIYGDYWDVLALTRNEWKGRR